MLRKRGHGGVTMTFGMVKDLLDEVVAARMAESSGIVTERRSVLASAEARERLARLVRDRNDEAHLRQPRRPLEIVDDVRALYGPEALPTPWPTLDAAPWISSVKGEAAVLWGVDFQRWAAEYLNPSTRASSWVALGELRSAEFS